MLNFKYVEEKKSLIKKLLAGPEISFGESEKEALYQAMSPDNAPVTYEFGEYNEEQIRYLTNENTNPHLMKGYRSPLRIKTYWGNYAAALGSEMCGLLKAWNEISREGLLTGGTCARDAQITFGYKDRVYRVDTSALGMSDGVMEKYAPYIMESMRLTGANYGEYLGFLD